VKKRAILSGSAILYGGSLILHVGAAVGLSLIPHHKKSEVVAISMTVAKKKGDDKPKPPDLPPPEPPKPAAAKTKSAPAPKLAAPPPEREAKNDAPPPTPGMENLLDMGMMGNGGSGPGMALGARESNVAPRPTATATTKRTEELSQTAEKCTDPVVRPHRKGGPQPAYTAPARQAEIEGVVKIEVTVDDTGRVTAARVVTPLGYGLDEAATAAAKHWMFEPATKCGRPVMGTATLPFRFKLGQ
jgi:periplasmic protein TonB